MLIVLPVLFDFSQLLFDLVSFKLLQGCPNQPSGPPLKDFHNRSLIDRVIHPLVFEEVSEFELLLSLTIPMARFIIFTSYLLFRWRYCRSWCIIFFRLFAT